MGLWLSGCERSAAVYPVNTETKKEDKMTSATAVSTIKYERPPMDVPVPFETATFALG